MPKIFCGSILPLDLMTETSAIKCHFYHFDELQVLSQLVIEKFSLGVA
jgi:hypothetical protein